MKRFSYKIYMALRCTKNKEAASSTHSKDLPLAAATLRSKELLIAQLTVQCSLLLYKADIGHGIFAMSTVKFFWMPGLP